MLFWRQKQYTISSCLHYQRRESNRFLNSSTLKALHGVVLLLYAPQICLAVVGRVPFGVSLFYCLKYIDIKLIIPSLRGRMDGHKALHWSHHRHCRCIWRASSTNWRHWGHQGGHKAWKYSLRRLEDWSLINSEIMRSERLFRFPILIVYFLCRLYDSIYLTASFEPQLYSRFFCRFFLHLPCILMTLQRQKGRNSFPLNRLSLLSSQVKDESNEVHRSATPNL